MTRTLIWLTVLHLVGRRRATLISLLAAIPVLIALLYRFANDDLDDPPPIEVRPVIIDTIVVTTLLPLVALVFGTAALGAEIEDGTAVYLLTKPIARWRIVAVKVGVASAVTVTLMAPTTLVSALIILGGDDPERIALAFTVAVAVGAIAYSSLFVGLSAVTSRALIVGLGYVFVWEAFVTNIFSGTRWVSVRHYVLELADLFSSAPASAFEAELGGVTAAIAAALLIAVSFAVGARALERFEIGERL